MKKLILASGSPRRKEILEQVGLDFCVFPSDVEEVITKQVPSDIVMELSRQKAEDVFQKQKEHIHAKDASALSLPLFPKPPSKGKGGDAR